LHENWLVICRFGHVKIKTLPLYSEVILNPLYAKFCVQLERFT